jgi:2',3'-cyclic-nucleotide 2'-phosphodiesterase (5'-nucleotidase family)
MASDLILKNFPSECFGGLARLSQTVKDIRAKDPNSIFVNGGDFYQGTSWYTLFKWKVVAPFANKLNFDASVRTFSI